jgi:hypothetical protein
MINYDAILVWEEPWDAIGPDGKEVIANVRISASARDCINLERKRLLKERESPSLEDEQLLDNFMVNNYATRFSWVLTDES